MRNKFIQIWFHCGMTFLSINFSKKIFIENLKNILFHKRDYECKWKEIWNAIQFIFYEKTFSNSIFDYYYCFSIEFSIYFKD